MSTSATTTSLCPDFSAGSGTSACLSVTMKGSSTLLVQLSRSAMSCCGEHARTKQVVTCPSIHLPFDRLEPVDLSLDRAGTPSLDNPGPYSVEVASDALGQAAEFA